MTGANLLCPLCGHRFEAAGAAGCEACPLSPGCQITCCPACGYSWVEPEQTVIGRWMSGWLARRRQPGKARLRGVALAPRTTLAAVQPGNRTRILSLDRLPEDRRRRLRAYGLTDGEVVEVLQQSPTTMIRLEQMEVALESDLARGILVEAVVPEHQRPKEA